MKAIGFTSAVARSRKWSCRAHERVKRIEGVPFIAILKEYANGVLAEIHLEIHSVNATECITEILTGLVAGKFVLLKRKMSFASRSSSEPREDLTFKALLDPAIPCQPVLYIRVLVEIGPFTICQIEIE